MLGFLSGLDQLRVASVCTVAPLRGADGLLDRRVATTWRHAAGAETVIVQPADWIQRAVRRERCAAAGDDVRIGDSNFALTVSEDRHRRLLARVQSYWGNPGLTRITQISVAHKNTAVLRG